MNPLPVSVVLVGCGAVAQQFYAPALRTLQKAGDLTVRALVDPSAEARAVLARTFPLATAGADLDSAHLPAGALAIIASPPRFHAAQTIAALTRGWHVLCEKPLAVDSLEATQMIALAARHQRILAAGLYKRFFPASRYLRSLCRDQLLGPLVSFTITEGGPFRWPAASRSFFEKSQSAGGVLTDIGVHVLDLLVWCLGLPAEISYADDAMAGLEANAWIGLAFPDGARGTVHLSRDWATEQAYTFTFERGLVRWKVNDANGLTVQLAGAPAALQANLVTPLAPGDEHRSSQLLDSNAQSFIASLRNVIAAMAGREELVVPASEALHSLQLIETCYARRGLLEQPWLTAAEASHAGLLTASVGNTYS